MIPPRVCEKCGTVVWAGQPKCPVCSLPKIEKKP